MSETEDLYSDFVEGTGGFFTGPIGSLSGVGSQIPGVGDVLGGITGETAAEASVEAARIQAQAGREALEFLKEQLAPITGTLETSIPLLENFITQDPAAFVQDNPLLNTLFADVEQRILANRAAGGLVGSGGTRGQLASTLIPLGMDIRQQRLNELMGFAQFGAGGAQALAGGGPPILQGIGNVRAAGVVGEAQSQQQGIQNLLNIGGSFFGMPGAGSAFIANPGGSTGAGVGSGL